MSNTFPYNAKDQRFRDEQETQERGSERRTIGNKKRDLCYQYNPITAVGTDYPVYPVVPSYNDAEGVSAYSPAIVSEDYSSPRTNTSTFQTPGYSIHGGVDMNSQIQPDASNQFASCPPQVTYSSNNQAAYLGPPVHDTPEHQTRVSQCPNPFSHQLARGETMAIQEPVSFKLRQHVCDMCGQENDLYVRGHQVDPERKDDQQLNICNDKCLNLLQRVTKSNVKTICYSDSKAKESIDSFKFKLPSGNACEYTSDKQSTLNSHFGFSDKDDNNMSTFGKFLDKCYRLGYKVEDSELTPLEKSSKSPVVSEANVNKVCDDNTEVQRNEEEEEEKNAVDFKCTCCTLASTDEKPLVPTKATSTCGEIDVNTCKEEPSCSTNEKSSSTCKDVHPTKTTPPEPNVGLKLHDGACKQDDSQEEKQEIPSVVQDICSIMLKRKQTRDLKQKNSCSKRKRSSCRYCESDGGIKEADTSSSRLSKNSCSRFAEQVKNEFQRSENSTKKSKKNIGIGRLSKLDSQNSFKERSKSGKINGKDSENTPPNTSTPYRRSKSSGSDISEYSMVSNYETEDASVTERITKSRYVDRREQRNSEEIGRGMKRESSTGKKVGTKSSRERKQTKSKANTPPTTKRISNSNHNSYSSLSTRKPRSRAAKSDCGEGNVVCGQHRESEPKSSVCKKVRFCDQLQYDTDED